MRRAYRRARWLGALTVAAAIAPDGGYAGDVTPTRFTSSPSPASG